MLEPATPENETQRLQALRASGLLHAPTDPALQDLAELAAAVLNMPMAMVSLVDEQQQWFHARVGTELSHTPRSAAFCAHAIVQPEPLVVPDALADPRFARNPLVCGVPNIRSYAGCPLRPWGEHALGTLCVASPQPRQFAEGDLAHLRRLGRLVEERMRHRGLLEQSRQQNARTALSLARKEAILNQAAVGIVRIDARGHMAAVNPHLLRMLGYTADELLGRNVSLLMPEPWAAGHDEAIASYLRGRAPSVIGTGREVAARHRDGRVLPVHLAVSRVQVPGQAEPEFIGILSDLSELQAARSRERAQHRLLQVLHRGMTDFAALMSSDQLWTFLKDALCELTRSDYALIGEVVDVHGSNGLLIRAITDLSWSEESRRLMQRLRSGDMLLTNPHTVLGRTFASGEVVLTRSFASDARRTGFPPGHPPLHNYLGVPIVDQGRLIGMYAIANSADTIDEDLLAWLQPFTATCALLIQLYRSMNERERFTRALEQAHAEQARASAAKTEFLSAMSHELRTPMNAVIGFSQLLLSDTRQPLSERQAAQVRLILSSGRHLLTLINDILDLSRIEAGRLAIEPQAVPVADVVRAAVHTVAAQAQSQQVGLHLHPPPSPATAWADPTRAQQVFINLLSNAIKYNRPGGRVDVAWTLTDTARVRITVQDTGVGIAADRLGELFQPFNRLGAEHGAVEGVGVGLALSKKLVEQMHGCIGAESTPGVGSAFWVELPTQAASAAEAAAELAAAEDAAPHPAVPQPGPLATSHPGPRAAGRVLYVEDNPANRRLLQDLFEDLPGYSLSCAASAEQGLELARRQLPDLLLLDIHLPGLDGFALLQTLRADPRTRHIPAVALSANAMPQDLERGIAAGFADYLTKPVDVARLTATLHRILGAPDA